VALFSGDPHRELWRDRGAIADGEWWRLGTSLVFQDGGAIGTVANLALLAVVGVLVERALGRSRWIALYLAGAVAGQLAGLALDQVGAGNSTAICGLAGGLLGAYARSRPARNAPDPDARTLQDTAGALRLAASVCCYYAVLMVSTQFSAPTVQTLVAVACGALGLQLVVRRHRLPGWLFTALGLACALPLALLGNLHGVALLGGGLLGALVGVAHHGPGGNVRGTDPEPLGAHVPA
jgi:membrane associated rhomboid family serine protease